MGYIVFFTKIRFAIVKGFYHSIEAVITCAFAFHFYFIVYTNRSTSLMSNLVDFSKNKVFDIFVRIPTFGIYPDLKLNKILK